MNIGTLYLIPSVIGDSPVNHTIPDHNTEIIGKLRYFIVEEIRSARRFLRQVSPTLVIDDLHFLIFNEHTPQHEIRNFIEPMILGNDTGLLSEAGLPCVADPGAAILRLAHEAGIRIRPLSGPSSLMLALMASGFNGQNFAFCGYLPIDKKVRINRIRDLERNVRLFDQTQIFIEAPYRNIQVFMAILESCHDDTLLCLATNLTSSSESVVVNTIKNWRGKHPDIDKKPTVFLLYR